MDWRWRWRRWCAQRDDADGDARKRIYRHRWEWWKWGLAIRSHVNGRVEWRNLKSCPIIGERVVSFGYRLRRRRWRVVVGASCQRWCTQRWIGWWKRWLTDIRRFWHEWSRKFRRFW